MVTKWNLRWYITFVIRMCVGNGWRNKITLVSGTYLITNFLQAIYIWWRTFTLSNDTKVEKPLWNTWLLSVVLLSGREYVVDSCIDTMSGICKIMWQLSGTTQRYPERYSKRCYDTNIDKQRKLTRQKKNLIQEWTTTAIKVNYK